MVDENPDPLLRSHEEFQDLRLRLRDLPNRPAPAKLIRALKRDFTPPKWYELRYYRFSNPFLWRPVVALILAVAVAGVWINSWKASEKELLDVQPLLAAHARYQDESMIPSGDLAGSNFGFQLASYYGENN